MVVSDTSQPAAPRRTYTAACAQRAAKMDWSTTASDRSNHAFATGSAKPDRVHRRRRHRVSGIVCACAAAGERHDERPTSGSVLSTEETVDHRIYAAARQCEPLNDGDHGVGQQFELGAVDLQRAAEEQADVDPVERQPTARKQYHDNHEHFHHALL
jgi:hypothetical protein